MHHATIVRALWGVFVLFVFLTGAVLVTLARTPTNHSGANVALALAILSICGMGVAAIGLLIQRWVIPISAAFQMGFRESERQNADRREHLAAVPKIG